MTRSAVSDSALPVQTPAALYNSLRVDSGHILSMRGRAWSPDDAERESERQERDCEPKTRKREKQRVRLGERANEGGREGSKSVSEM
jgi:hypothetical protein